MQRVADRLLGADSLKPNDKVFFSGGDWTSERTGSKRVYGTAGVVTGSAGPDHGHSETKVQVSFPGNEGPIACLVSELSRTWPPAFKRGDAVVYTGAESGEFSCGDKKECGVRGEMMGADDRYEGYVQVRFPGNTHAIPCRATDLVHVKIFETTPACDGVGDEGGADEGAAGDAGGDEHTGSGDDEGAEDGDGGLGCSEGGSGDEQQRGSETGGAHERDGDECAERDVKREGEGGSDVDGAGQGDPGGGEVLDGGDRAVVGGEARGAGAGQSCEPQS
jgi:hypothetical protein